MAIIDSPAGERWYAAAILGDADLTGLAALDPRTTGYQAQLASRSAVAQLLPSTLDVYLTAHTRTGFSSVRITNIPLGTFGLAIPVNPASTQAQVAMRVWIGDNGDQVRVPTDDDFMPPLSAAIAVHAVRRALSGAPAHVFDLGQYGRITWKPTAVLIDPTAGVPVPFPDLREIPYDAPVIGNYTSPDPEYAVWLRFTDAATGEAEETAYPLTPTLTGMHPDPVPPRPPLLSVPDLVGAAPEQPE